MPILIESSLLHLLEFCFYPALVKPAREMKSMKSGLRHWYALHYVYPKGATVTPREVCDLLFEFCGVLERNVYLVMHKWNHVYWVFTPGSRKLGEGTVRIFNLTEVCQSLGVSSPGRFITRPIGDLSDPLFIAKTWELCCEDAQGNRDMMTQAKWKEATGFSIKMQNTYNRRLGIKMVRQVKVVAIDENIDHIIECARAGGRGCYPGNLCLEGMTKPVHAAFKTIGSSHPTKLQSDREESQLMLLGTTKSGTVVWVERMNLALVEEYCSKTRPQLEGSTCTWRAEAALESAHSQADAATTSDDTLSRDDGWHPPLIDRCVELPPNTRSGYCKFGK